MEGWLLGKERFDPGTQLTNQIIDPDIPSLFRTIGITGGSILTMLRNETRWLPTVNGKLLPKVANVVFSEDISEELRKFALWCVGEVKLYDYRVRIYKHTCDLWYRELAGNATATAYKYLGGEISYEEMVVVHKTLLLQIQTDESDNRGGCFPSFRKRPNNAPPAYHSIEWFAENAALATINPDPGMASYLAAEYVERLLSRFNNGIYDNAGHRHINFEFQRMMSSIINF